MKPDFPYTLGSTQDTDTFTNYTPPTDPLQPAGSPEPGMETAPGRHRGHHWMHLLMCAPMLLVVGYLVLTGRAGGGSIFYAVGCMAMMGVMMAMMNHGSSTDDSGTHPRGHRH
jgi:hypothetical protein